MYIMQSRASIGRGFQAFWMASIRHDIFVSGAYMDSDMRHRNGAFVNSEFVLGDISIMEGAIKR